MVNDDDQLVERFRSGDDGAGDQLFSRHHRRVERFFESKVVPVDDLVQQTFLECVVSIRRGLTPECFQVYLLGIAANVLHAFIRREVRALRRAELLEFEWWTMSAEQLGPGPSTVVRKREQCHLVRRALRRIPLAYQTVLELRYWEELTPVQIGIVLRLPKNTVRSRILHGRALLEAQLKREANSPEEFERVVSNFRQWVAVVRGDHQRTARSSRRVSRRLK